MTAKPEPAITLSEAIKEELVASARTVAANAYAPYSRFRVGAAVYSSGGSIYLGANVENASYGLSLCAERSALSRALAEGEAQFLAIAVACVDAQPGRGIEEMLPCGACRQWLVELAGDAQVFVWTPDGVKSYSVGDLLPNPFRLKAKRAD